MMYPLEVELEVTHEPLAEGTVTIVAWEPSTGTVREYVAAATLKSITERAATEQETRLGHDLALVYDTFPKEVAL